MAGARGVRRPAGVGIAAWAGSERPSGLDWRPRGPDLRLRTGRSSALPKPGPGPAPATAALPTAPAAAVSVAFAAGADSRARDAPPRVDGSSVHRTERVLQQTNFGLNNEQHQQRSVCDGSTLPTWRRAAKASTAGSCCRRRAAPPCLAAAAAAAAAALCGKNRLRPPPPRSESANARRKRRGGGGVRGYCVALALVPRGGRELMCKSDCSTLLLKATIGNSP
ncbi:Protein of unknown function [Gryllus bimaculatus]|nr:Protein of unknown function [Gryllus bimaculatus]